MTLLPGPLDSFQFYPSEAVEKGLILGLKRSGFHGFYRMALKSETPDALAAHPETIQAIKDGMLKDWYLVVAKEEDSG